MSVLKYEPVKSFFISSERDKVTMPDFQIILAQHGKSSEEAREQLADEISRRIKEWVSTEKKIWDKEKKILRNVKYSDFAILSRSRSFYEILESSLDKFNIKSVRDKSDDYFNRIEIHDIICTLRAAADFNDDFAVIGWLISPFSGF